MSDETYIYQEPDPNEEQTQRGGMREPLPPGDYQFVVLKCEEPYKKQASGNLVLPLTLEIQPSKDWVWSRPWTGTNRKGERRDNIGEFLRSVNRAPKPGTTPNWETIIGAKGVCRLKIDKPEDGPYAGKESNAVDYFHAPKAVGPGAGELKFSQQEYAKGMQKPASKTDDEPDDIPF